MDMFDLDPTFYLREFDHVNGVPPLLPLFGFLITVEENTRGGLQIT